MISVWPHSDVRIRMLIKIGSNVRECGAYNFSGWRGTEQQILLLTILQRNTILATVRLLFRGCKLNLNIMPLWLFHCIGVSVLSDRKMSDFFQTGLGVSLSAIWQRCMLEMWNGQRQKMLFCFILFYSVSFRFVSFYFILFHLISFYFISFDFVSFRFILFCFILFYRRENLISNAKREKLHN